MKSSTLMLVLIAVCSSLAMAREKKPSGDPLARRNAERRMVEDAKVVQEAAEKKATRDLAGVPDETPCGRLSKCCAKLSDTTKKSTCEYVADVQVDSNCKAAVGLFLECQ